MGYYIFLHHKRTHTHTATHLQDITRCGTAMALGFEGDVQYTEKLCLLPRPGPACLLLQDRGYCQPGIEEEVCPRFFFFFCSNE